MKYVAAVQFSQLVVRVILETLKDQELLIKFYL